MSRTDTEPVELIGPHSDPQHEVITPREVPLGGPRAMTVRRTLPNRSRTTIGAWCFLDHYGPDPVAETGGMMVPPHPHIGLQTVSWLFAGEIEHHDSTGANALVTPGVLNLMTAGAGIQHSEVSTPNTSVLHGVQLWLVLPGDSRAIAPRFDAAAATTHQLTGATLQVFMGSLPEFRGVDAPTLTPLVAAEIQITPGASLSLALDDQFEHGILVDSGEVRANGTSVPTHHLAYFPPSTDTLELHAGKAGARMILIGGAPFDEEIVMWWNFVGRSHEEIQQARTDWQAGLDSGSTRFGHLEHMSALPAPELPRVRLKARGRRPAFPSDTRNTLSR